MKREIKFRGWDIYSDCWLYGDLLTCQSPLPQIIRDEHDITPNGAGTDVAPDSVGQYTGLKDRNGVEIYEGDILSVCNGSINGVLWMDKKPYAVEYKLNKGFIMPMFCWDADGQNRMDPTHWCEVIGNIYEHPHLLEGGE